jgi:hypothetical protein
MISEIGTRSYRVEGGYAPIPGQAANDRSSSPGRGPCAYPVPFCHIP